MVFNRLLLVVMMVASFFISSCFSYEVGEYTRAGNRMNFGIRVRLLPQKLFCDQAYNTIQAAVRVPTLMDTLFVDGNKFFNGLNGKKMPIGEAFKTASSVDASVFSIDKNSLYLFSGSFAFAYDFSNAYIESIYTLSPTEVHHPEASVRINVRDGKEILLLIKNGKAWIWDPQSANITSEQGFSVQKIFPRIPNHIDAAISGENNEVYFFDGEDYYIQQAYTKKSTTGKLSDFRHFDCSMVD